MADKKATRNAYGEALAELGEKYDFLVMDADLSKSTMTATFKKVFPDRFINAGIAEANMVSVAAGIATTGMPVFCSSFAMFAAGRAFEQVRNAVGYPHLNVKIAATHAGMSVGEDGATLQCCEDIALMTAIPGLIVLSPADEFETKAAVKAALEIDGPVYLRLGRLAVEPLYDASIDFKVGKAQTLKEGNDVTIIATGLMVYEALKAHDILKAEGINARVLDMSSLKPIDKDAIIKASNETGAIVTAEEHNVFGGLGSLVASVVCEAAPCPVLKVGVNDSFGKSGKVQPVLDYFGLNAATIVENCKKAISLK